MNYIDFINSKKKRLETPGIEVEESELNPKLKDFQKYCVRKALKKKRFALFEACGLGKTFQQLEWAYQVCKHTGGNVLIVAYLGVAVQTAKEEAPKFGYEVNICRNQKEVKKGINITNYEMIDEFDCSSFIGVILDESSILKNFTGSIRTKLTNSFKDTEYKLCCTATPSPNDLMELLNHADFLGITSTAKALSKYFINDMKTGSWRLKGHATKDFYQWVCTWSINIETPSDLGFDGSEYVLPRLNELNETIQISEIDDEFQNGFFRKIETSATGFHKEKKRTAQVRAKRCSRIVEKYHNEQFLIWCDTNEEADYLKEFIKDAVEVRGSDKQQFKVDSSLAFKNGDIRVLISKPSIFGYGMNFQKCHNVIFCGLTYSYENYYQALRRIYRFGQTHEVNSWIVLGSTELHILDVINKKKRMQEELKNQMDLSIRDIQINEVIGKEVNKVIQQDVLELPAWI